MSESEFQRNLTKTASEPTIKAAGSHFRRGLRQARDGLERAGERTARDCASELGDAIKRARKSSSGLRLTGAIARANKAQKAIEASAARSPKSTKLRPEDLSDVVHHEGYWMARTVSVTIPPPSDGILGGFTTDRALKIAGVVIPAGEHVVVCHADDKWWAEFKTRSATPARAAKPGAAPPARAKGYVFTVAGCKACDALLTAIKERRSTAGLTDHDAHA